MVEQGADVNVVGRNGNRYVHFKTEKHFSNDVVIPSRPLHLAAQLTNDPDIVDVLLERGADINTINSTGTTALCIACQANNIFSASTLLNRGMQCHYVFC